MTLGVVAGGGFLAHFDSPGPAQIKHFDVAERQSKVIANHVGSGKRGHVLHHGLASVAETRRLHGACFERAGNRIDDQCGQDVIVDFLVNHQKGTVGLTVHCERSSE